MTANSTALQTILQVFFAILAAISVLVITIGGFRYVLSEGSPDSTAKARSTIIYAVVGLVIAVSAEGFVTFILGNLQL